MADSVLDGRAGPDQLWFGQPQADKRQKTGRTLDVGGQQAAFQRAPRQHHPTTAAPGTFNAAQVATTGPAGNLTGVTPRAGSGHLTWRPTPPPPPGEQARRWATATPSVMDHGRMTPPRAGRHGGTRIVVGGQRMAAVNYRT